MSFGWGRKGKMRGSDGCRDARVGCCCWIEVQVRAGAGTGAGVGAENETGREAGIENEVESILGDEIVVEDEDKNEVGYGLVKGLGVG